MALTLTLKELPGYKIAKSIYDQLPGKGKMKKVIFGVLAVGAIAAAVAAGSVGIVALISFGTWLLAAPLLVQLGVLLGLSALFAFGIRAVQYVWNFNWAISDTEIESQIQQSFEGFYGLFGEFAGSLMGYLVCGALPGALSLAINKSVAVAVYAELGEEAKDELLGQLAGLANTVFGTLMNAAILKAFKSGRRYLKKRPNNPISQILREKMGEENFKKWGNQSGQTFSLSSQTEEYVENIKDPRLRSFTEEFLEGFTDSCLEAGYTVVNTIESTMAAQHIMNRRAGLDPDEEIIRIGISP